MGTLTSSILKSVHISISDDFIPPIRICMQYSVAGYTANIHGRRNIWYNLAVQESFCLRKLIKHCGSLKAMKDLEAPGDLESVLRYKIDQIHHRVGVRPVNRTLESTSNTLEHIN